MAVKGQSKNSQMACNIVFSEHFKRKPKPSDGISNSLSNSNRCTLDKLGASSSGLSGAFTTLCDVRAVDQETRNGVVLLEHDQEQETMSRV